MKFKVFFYFLLIVIFAGVGLYFTATAEPNPTNVDIRFTSPSAVLLGRVLQSQEFTDVSRHNPDCYQPLKRSRLFRRPKFLSAAGFEFLEHANIFRSYHLTSEEAIRCSAIIESDIEKALNNYVSRRKEILNKAIAESLINLKRAAKNDEPNELIGYFATKFLTASRQLQELGDPIWESPSLTYESMSVFKGARAVPVLIFSLIGLLVSVLIDTFIAHLSLLPKRKN